MQKNNCSSYCFSKLQLYQWKVFLFILVSLQILTGSVWLVLLIGYVLWVCLVSIAYLFILGKQRWLCTGHGRNWGTSRARQSYNGNFRYMFGVRGTYLEVPCKVLIPDTLWVWQNFRKYPCFIYSLPINFHIHMCKELDVACESTFKSRKGKNHHLLRAFYTKLYSMLDQPKPTSFSRIYINWWLLWDHDCLFFFLLNCSYRQNGPLGLL